MHTTETKKYMLHLLTVVRNSHIEGSGDDHIALCAELSYADDYSGDYSGPDASWYDVTAYKKELFQQWPEFSGNVLYPVTVDFEDLTVEEFAAIEEEYGQDDDGADLDWSDSEEVASAIYFAVDNCGLYGGNFWDRATAYGAARWRLLDWMIEKVKEEISNED